MVNDSYMDKEFTIKNEIDLINQDIERQEKETIKKQKKQEEREIKTIKEKFSKQFMHVMGSSVCGDMNRRESKQ